MAKLDNKFSVDPYISTEEARIWLLLSKILDIMLSSVAEIQEMKIRNYVCFNELILFLINLGFRMEDFKRIWIFNRNCLHSRSSSLCLVLALYCCSLNSFFGSFYKLKSTNESCHSVQSGVFNFTIIVIIIIIKT
jgi:hypothetical protein